MIKEKHEMRVSKPTVRSSVAGTVDAALRCRELMRWANMRHY